MNRVVDYGNGSFAAYPNLTMLDGAYEIHRDGDETLCLGRDLGWYLTTDCERTEYDGDEERTDTWTEYVRLDGVLQAMDWLAGRMSGSEAADAVSGAVARMMEERAASDVSMAPESELDPLDGGVCVLPAEGRDGLSLWYTPDGYWCYADVTGDGYLNGIEFISRRSAWEEAEDRGVDLDVAWRRAMPSQPCPRTYHESVLYLVDILADFDVRHQLPPHTPEEERTARQSLTRLLYAIQCEATAEPTRSVMSIDVEAWWRRTYWGAVVSQRRQGGVADE